MSFHATAMDFLCQHLKRCVSTYADITYADRAHNLWVAVCGHKGHWPAWAPMPANDSCNEKRRI